jgi:hypothetical protein
MVRDQGAEEPGEADAGADLEREAALVASLHAEQ